MRTSVKTGWIVTILVFTIIFSFIVAGSDDWYMHEVLVQEAVYEYVPSPQIRISAYWIGATAFSVFIGIFFGFVIYSNFREEEKKNEQVKG